MATNHIDTCRLRRLISTGLIALAATQPFQFASAEDEAVESSDEAVCSKMIDEMANEIHKYCKARNLNTLQYLQFLGAHGTVSNEALEKQLFESLTKRGIEIQKLDSTRLRGKIASQASGESSILLVQCTLTDANGSELRTFRLRQVIARSSSTTSVAKL